MTESEQLVTIVSGLPRSGTSLMMCMLESGGIPVLTDGVESADEDNPQGYYEYEPVKKTKEDASWLRLASGKAVKVFYHFLCDLPPHYQYRVIFMRRSMSEVLASQKIMMNRRDKASRRVLLPADEKLVALGELQIRECREWAEGQKNVSILEANYNELLASPQEVLQSINRFLGADLNMVSMARVIDADLYRNRGWGDFGKI